MAKKKNTKSLIFQAISTGSHVIACSGLGQAFSLGFFRFQAGPGPISGQATLVFWKNKEDSLGPRPDPGPKHIGLFLG